MKSLSSLESLLKAIFAAVLIASTASLAPTAAPSTVRSSQWNIIDLAGTGTPASSGTGGAATSASYFTPRVILTDTAGTTTYIAEVDGNCIRKFGTDHIVTVFAGVCGTTPNYGGDSGAASSAFFNYPYGMGINSATNVLYLSDSRNNRIRSVSSGIINTYGGNGGITNTGDGGPVTSAVVYSPCGMFLDTIGSIYFANYFSSIVRTISASGIINLFAGTTQGYSGNGGAATSACLKNTESVFGDSTGFMYISDSGNNVVRSVSLSGIISAFAGSASADTSYNGESVVATACNLNNPTGMTVDPSNGDFFISSNNNHRVVVITHTTLLTTTFAGTGVGGDTGNNGAATAAQLFNPDGLFRDSLGMIHVAAMSSNKVRSIFSVSPTNAPTVAPSLTPTVLPSIAPTVAPTVTPSVAPSAAPTVAPSLKPTILPTVAPSAAPSVLPSIVPSVLPSVAPSQPPTVLPSVTPSLLPSVTPSLMPTALPSKLPTYSPSLTFNEISRSVSYSVINAEAFAGVKSDGSVITWGSQFSGGDSSAVSSLLVNVVEVASSRYAFAARKSDGSVVAWGNAESTAGSSEFRSYTTIVSLVATERAFAGLTRSGGVIAFGARCCGGNVDQYGWSQYLSSDVVSVHASSGAFAALKSDGTVYTWGSEFAGGGVSSLTHADLKDIVMLTSTRSSFAGLTSAGNVVTWGNAISGGAVSSETNALLTGKTEYIVSGREVFVGYTDSDGLVTWGATKYGGGVSYVNTAAHVSIARVVSTNGAIAALLSNGSVLAWGQVSQGGELSAAARSHINVTSIVGTLGAFAALSNDGVAVSWGSEDFGASDKVITGVNKLYSTDRAFGALHVNGSVSAWGAESYGGSVGSVSSYLSANVVKLCTNAVSFTSILHNGSAVAWGHRTSLGVEQIVLSGNFSGIVSC